MSDGAIDAIVEHAGSVTSPLSDVKVVPLGGAMASVPGEESAFSHRGAPFIVNINARWGPSADRDEAERHIEWTRSFWSAMQPFSAGGVYVNFLGDEGGSRVRAAYDPGKYGRLVAVKNRYDPSNVFRINQNIAPE